MTSVVLTQRLVTVLACYTKALNESEPHTPCHKFTAVQTTNLWLPNKLLMILASYNKIALHRVTTKPPVTIIGFDIWNFIFLLSATRFSAVCSDTANQWREERPPPPIGWMHLKNTENSAQKCIIFAYNFEFFFWGKGKAPPQTLPLPFCPLFPSSGFAAAANRFYLTVHYVINYNDVTSATESLQKIYFVL